ncbi:MAG: hypothetical protein ACI9R3_001596 [Verrucomicrobiales bacterium]|jgi:hypothetical protein
MTQILIRTIVVLLAVSMAAIACQVPVFRYALERWEADDYRIVVFEKGPRAEATAALIEQLQQASRHSESGDGHANIIIEFADIENLTDAQQWSLLDWNSIEIFPAMQVYYPDSTGIEAPLWHGQLTGANIGKLLTSPARTELTKRITAGDSAIWILLQSGDAAADAIAEEKLRASLSQVAAKMSIPEGVIRPEELAHAINNKEAPVEMDDVLRSRIPLKIAFSILRVDPMNPSEELFSQMLTASDNRSTGLRAIPVFGRGRMMPGLDASMFTVPAIGGASDYLCGACSCQVKEQNPGLDLLIDFDWSRHLVDGLIATERVLPPLSGAGDVADDEISVEPAESAKVQTIPQPFLSIGVLVTIGLVVVSVLAGSVVLMLRR